MPYKTEWVPAEPFMTHRGVVVYRTYKEDEIYDPWDYWFSWNRDNSELDESKFDIRELPGWYDVIPGETINEAKIRVLQNHIDDMMKKGEKPWEPYQTNEST